MHAFNDLMLNNASNDAIADLVPARIRQTVKDPATADALCPTDHPLSTKRICVDTGYFETCNRDNVRLPDQKKTSVVEVTPSGIAAGTEHVELDALVCATGYDALTGAVLQIDIRGRGGESLASKWAQGPRTLLGLMTSGFPNLFIITGAGSPSVLVNMVVGIEHHVERICDCLQYLRDHGLHRIEAERDAEDHWVAPVNEAAARTLFSMANSWFLGASIPGKPRVFMPCVARIAVYRRECQDIADKGYQGFSLGTVTPGAPRPPAVRSGPSQNSETRH